MHSYELFTPVSFWQRLCTFVVINHLHHWTYFHSQHIDKSFSFSGGAIFDYFHNVYNVTWPVIEATSTSWGSQTIIQDHLRTLPLSGCHRTDAVFCMVAPGVLFPALSVVSPVDAICLSSVSFGRRLECKIVDIINDIRHRQWPRSAVSRRMRGDNIGGVTTFDRSLEAEWLIRTARQSSRRSRAGGFGSVP